MQVDAWDWYVRWERGPCFWVWWRLGRVTVKYRWRWRVRFWVWKPRDWFISQWSMRIEPE